MTTPSGHQRMTLDEIATAATELLTDARTAGLPAPFSMTVNDYGTAAATFLLFSGRHDAPAVLAELQQWADRYDAAVTTRPSVNPGTIQATAEFQRGGLTYEVSAFIHPDPDNHQDDEDEQDQAA